MSTEEVQQRHLNHDPYWAADLMVELENKCLGMSLGWALDSMKALIENTHPLYQRTALNWLTELASTLEDPPPSSELMAKSQQIWNEERDMIHTGISHLYAAAAKLAENNVSLYRRSIVSAMNVMGDHEFYRKTSVAIPLALFNKFMAR